MADKPTNINEIGVQLAIERYVICAHNVRRLCAQMAHTLMKLEQILKKQGEIVWHEGNDW